MPNRCADTVYVGNLDFGLRAEDLQKTFEQYGRVLRITICSDNETGVSHGFGFVKYASESEAENALAANGTLLVGRTLIVQAQREETTESKSKSEEKKQRQRDEPTADQAIDIEDVTVEKKNSAEESEKTKCPEVKSPFEEMTRDLKQELGFTDDKTYTAPSDKQDYDPTKNTNPASVYVGNLDYAIRAHDLTEFFSQFGFIERVTICSDPDSNQSHGYGFVKFQTEEQAEASIVANGFLFCGRKLVVQRIQKRPNTKYRYEARKQAKYRKAREFAQNRARRQAAPQTQLQQPVQQQPIQQQPLQQQPIQQMQYGHHHNNQVPQMLMNPQQQLSNPMLSPPLLMNPMFTQQMNTQMMNNMDNASGSTGHNGEPQGAQGQIMYMPQMQMPYHAPNMYLPQMQLPNQQAVQLPQPSFPFSPHIAPPADKNVEIDLPSMMGQMNMNVSPNWNQSFGNNHNASEPQGETGIFNP